MLKSHRTLDIVIGCVAAIAVALLPGCGTASTHTVPSQTGDAPAAPVPHDDGHADRVGDETAVADRTDSTGDRVSADLDELCHEDLMLLDAPVADDAGTWAGIILIGCALIGLILMANAAGKSSSN